MDAEQVARNDAIFREANEHIEQVAQKFGHAGQVPFICECPQPDCREIVPLTIAQYEHVRARPMTFLVVAGHEDVAPDLEDVVERGEGFVIIEKVGEAAEVLEELDTGQA
jgi:hypothetical protein